MVLGQIFSPEAICVNLQSESKDEVFEELVEKLVEVYSGLDRTKVLNALLEREQKMSTGIFPGIAVPHARTDMVDKVCLMVASVVIVQLFPVARPAVLIVLFISMLVGITCVFLMKR